MFDLNAVRLIQGGMGVYVSNWRLAKAVAMEKPGVTAGTVSGTALDIVHARLLQLGDPGGHICRALQAFDRQFNAGIGAKLVERYYLPGGKAPTARYRNTPRHNLRTVDGRAVEVQRTANPGPLALSLEPEAIELLIASSFAEVWLARQDHNGLVFINFLNKIEAPLVYCMYGAMLAGVDGVVVGAGNPDGLPQACSRLARHEPVQQPLTVLYREAGEELNLQFDPRQVAGGRLAGEPLKRPAFLAIVSLQNLVLALAQSQSGPPDGFIIEHHTAGGHNAAPQGPLKLDESGQPVYGPEDEPDLEAIRQAGLPFWLAGGYGSRQKLAQAQAAGARGVQVGTAFALAEESGLRPEYRNAIFAKLRQGISDAGLVRTTLYSPTGFPFKVAQLEGTLSSDEVYTRRRRVCDLGILQQPGLSKPGEDGSRRLFQRCSAAPLSSFVSKRGLERNTEGRRCLCNGLVSAIGLPQVGNQDDRTSEEPSIVTLGNHLDAVRRLSRQGQARYWARDVISDLLGEEG